MNTYTEFLIDGVSYQVIYKEIEVGDKIVVVKVDGHYVDPKVRYVVDSDEKNKSITLDQGVDFYDDYFDEGGRTTVLLLDDPHDEAYAVIDEDCLDYEDYLDEEEEESVDAYAAESYSVADVLYEYIEEMKFVHKLTLAEAVNILSSTGFLTDNQIAAAWISVAKIESTVEVPPILALEAFMNGEVVYEIEDDGGVVPLSYDQGSEFTYSKESDLEHGRVFHVSKVYAEENYGL